MYKRIVLRLTIALILTLPVWLVSSVPAAAQDAEDYFRFDYDPIVFDKNEIQGAETFNMTISGRAVSIKDAPIAIKEANIVSRVAAKHAVTDATIILNPGYTVTIKPFPSKKDEFTEINQVVPLQFPGEAETGDYNVIGEIIEAKVDFGLFPLDVSEYLPQSQQIGTVKYDASGVLPAPESPSVPEPTPIQIPEPEPEPATSLPAPLPVSPEHVMTWWVWVIVAAAAATTLFNIIWYLRHRRGW